MLLVSALSGAQLGALAGFEDFRTVARVNLMAAVVGGPPRLIGAYLRGLEGAVWGMIAAAILSCLVIHFALLSKCNEERIGFKLANCWKECGVLFSFSLPAVLAGMLCIPTVWLCSAMLVNQPGGYAELGVYGAASQWRNLILFLPWMIGQVSIPMLSAQDFHQNKREIFAILKSLLYTYCLATIPILAVACALSPFIMDFYGPDYSGTWPVLVLILFATSLQVIQAPVVKFMEATGRMWTNLIISMVWTITVLCFSQQFIQYGALGLCIALVIAFAIEGLLLFAYGVKVLWEPGTNTQLQISLGKE
jgi:O-antigen/teichoic acid export membrane protein